MKPCIFHPEAGAEYTQAVEYYAAIRPELGNRFYDEIERRPCWSDHEKALNGSKLGGIAWWKRGCMDGFWAPFSRLYCCGQAGVESAHAKSQPIYSSGRIYHLTHRRGNFNMALEKAIINDELTRQAKWTEAIAVGDRAYVDAIEQQTRTNSCSLRPIPTIVAELNLRKAKCFFAV